MCKDLHTRLFIMYWPIYSSHKHNKKNKLYEQHLNRSLCKMYTYLNLHTQYNNIAFFLHDFPLS